MNRERSRVQRGDSSLAVPGAAEPGSTRTEGSSRIDWGRLLVRYLLVAILLTLAIVVGVPVVRTLWVQKAIATAVRLIEAGRPSDALVELQRVEEHAAFHPDGLCRLDLVAILAYARAGDWDRATRLAENLASRDRKLAAPSDAWSAVASLPAPLISALVQWFHGGRRPDPKSGQALLERERQVAEWRNLWTDGPLRSVDRSAAEGARSSGTRPPRMTSGDHRRNVQQGEGRSSGGLGWGVVIDPQASVYDLSGNWLRRVEPGTLVEVISIENSSTGPVARCSALGGSQLGADVCIPCRWLALQRGSLSSVSPEERSLRVRWATLVARREALRRSLDPRNPHAAELQRLEAANREFWKKAGELIRRRDAATGEERMRLIDQLRTMKGEDERIGRALEQAKARYEAWQAAHPRPLETEPEWQKLQAEIEALEEELARFSRPS